MHVKGNKKHESRGTSFGFKLAFKEHLSNDKGKPQAMKAHKDKVGGVWQCVIKLRLKYNGKKTFVTLMSSGYMNLGSHVVQCRSSVEAANTWKLG